MTNDNRCNAETFAQARFSSVETTSDPARRRPRAQFTIGYLLTATAVVAYLLAIPRVFYLIAIALSAPFLPMFTAQWLLARRHRRIAASGFWVAATLINLYIAISCVAPNGNSLAFTLIFPGLFVSIPMIASLGTAWALMLSRDEAISPRAREAAGITVLLMAVLPIVTLWTFWPLRVAFLAARPGIERLANQVAAGSAVGFPQRAGVFNVVRPAIEPVSHYIGLRIDTNGSQPTGFVRLHPGPTRKSYGAFIGRNFDVYLGDGWWYRG